MPGEEGHSRDTKGHGDALLHELTAALALGEKLGNAAKGSANVIYVPVGQMGQTHTLTLAM